MTESVLSGKTQNKEPNTRSAFQRFKPQLKKEEEERQRGREGRRKGDREGCPIGLPQR